MGDYVDPNSGRVMQPGGVAYRGPVEFAAGEDGGEGMFDVGVADEVTQAQEAAVVDDPKPEDDPDPEPELPTVAVGGRRASRTRKPAKGAQS